MKKLVFAYYLALIALNWHEVDCQNWPAQDVARADKVRKHYGDVQQSGSFGGQNFKIFSFLTTQPNLAYGSTGVQKQSSGHQASVKVGGSGLPPYLPSLPTTKKTSSKQTKGQNKPNKTRKRKKTGMYARLQKPPLDDTLYEDDDYWQDYYENYDEEGPDDYSSGEDDWVPPKRQEYRDEGRKKSSGLQTGPRRWSNTGTKSYQKKKKATRPQLNDPKILPNHQQNPLKWEEVLKQAEEMVAGKDADGFDTNLDFFDSLFGKQFDDLEKLAKPVKPKQTLRSSGPQGPLGG